MDQFEWKICASQSGKKNINEPNNLFLVGGKLLSGVIESKSRNPQKPHLKPLLNLYIKFQLLSSISKRNNLCEGWSFFKVKEGKIPHISPTNGSAGLIFGYLTQLQILYRLTQKQLIFVIFIP